MSSPSNLVQQGMSRYSFQSINSYLGCSIGPCSDIKWDDQWRSIAMIFVGKKPIHLHTHLAVGFILIVVTAEDCSQHGSP